MEIHVTPAGFNVARIQVPTPDGPVDAMRFTIMDATGVAVSATFAMKDWEGFQRYVADPEAEVARQQARAKIALPVDGRAPSLKTRKLH